MLRGIVHQMRWLGLSLVWSALLLCGLFFAAVGPTMPKTMAASTGTTADTPVVEFSAASYSMNEGDASGTITLTIVPAGSAPLTVTVSSSNLDAEAGRDYVGLRQSLVITPSVSSVTLSVQLLDDVLIEEAEQLRLTLGNLQGVASLGTITETIVIIEDDDFVQLSVGDVVVSEEDAHVALVITQSVVSTLESRVDFRTLDGSATAPSDYVATSGSVSIPPGSTQATVMIALTSDEEAEPTESFFVQLENPLNAGLATVSATVTILDDEHAALPQLEVASAEASEAEGILSFVMSLSSSSSQTVTVEYATVDGTAIAPADYLTKTETLIISPGNLSATVLVSLAHDDLDEPDENLFLVLSNPVQAILEVSEAEGIIRDSPQRSGDHLFLPGLRR